MEHMSQLQNQQLLILTNFKIFCSFKCKFTPSKDMKPVSNQPGRLYAIAKTHKFNSLDEITVENLIF